MKRRELISGTVALATLFMLSDPASAKEVSLGKASQIAIGAAKLFNVGSSRILVYRPSSAKYVAFTATCPHDGVNLSASNVKAGKVTCPKDKTVFSAATGKKLSGPATKSLQLVPLKISKGFLVASLAVTVTPVPKASQDPAEEALVATSKVPVGGGLKVSSSVGEIIIVQPSFAKFAAFSVICNHAGCAVSRVTASSIICACHGSEFSTANGSVTQGPATQALRQYNIFERDGQVFLR